VELDKRAYISGILVFYETGDTELLSDAIAHSYECTAPHFAWMASGQRVPSQVELRFGKRIELAIARIVRDGQEPGTVLDSLLANQDSSVRDEIGSIVTERLDALSPFHAPIYGLEEEEIMDWLAGSDRSP